MGSELLTDDLSGFGSIALDERSFWARRSNAEQ